MKCPACGKENEEGKLYCTGCGVALQEQEQEQAQEQGSWSEWYAQQEEKKKKKKRWLYNIGMALLAGVLILMFVERGGIDLLENIAEDVSDFFDEFYNPTVGGGEYDAGYDIEYTNPSSDKMPIIVDSVGFSEIYGNTEITLYIQNTKDEDYKTASFVLMVWDSNGLPVRIDHWTDYTDGEYMCYLEFENIAAYEGTEYTWQFEKIEDIGYVAAFLADCEAYSGERWENPILDEYAEQSGQTLDNILTYYLIFEKTE